MELARYVWSQNYHRRQLTESQRGISAAKMANMTQGGDRKSENIKGSIEPLISPVSIAEAAQMAGVGEGSRRRVADRRRPGVRLHNPARPTRNHRPGLNTQPCKGGQHV